MKDLHPTRLTIPRPDDMHLHLRDGAMLAAVLPDTARHFARAIVMPNLVPPVVTAAQAAAYRDRIMAVLPAGVDFTPLMTLYLTEDTDPADVAHAHATGIATAVKLYPAGALACAILTKSARCSRKWPRSGCRCVCMAK
jgi:dihydroorotase